MEANNSNYPLIFFDGVCNLCNGSVDFIITRDRGYFKFASLQSQLARNLDIPAEPLESIILFENGVQYTHSTAALKIAKHLKVPWNFLAILIIVPKPIRDWVYDWVAKNRYKWFGKRESCRLPTENERSRILA